MSRVRLFGGRPLHAAVLAAFLLLCTSTTRGQDVTEVALKAAFIYNFAKFTEWPADVLSASAPLSACVLGDLAVGDALERTVKDRLAGGHSIKVSRVTAGGPLQQCHLVYISGVASKQAVRVATDLRGLPVLTISDIEHFARLGGIAEFFVENGRMRFGVNLESAKRSRLQLSSKLLALAQLVTSEASNTVRVDPLFKTPAEASTVTAGEVGARGDAAVADQLTSNIPG